MLLRLDRTRPLVEQIVRHIAAAIRSTQLHPGDRLPPSRRLAATHGIGRNTVVSAYQQLAAEGYVETRRAGGTIVARGLPRAPALWPAKAVASAVPALRRGALSREARRLLRDGETLAPLTMRAREGLRWDFQYNANVADSTSRRAWARILARRVRTHELRPPAWDPSRRGSPLLEPLASYLARTRAVQARPEQILLVSTPQAAFQLAAQLLVNPGDRVVLEDPHYIGIRTTMRARGARLLPVPVDDRGLRTDLLPEHGRPRLAYVTPSHQWPTGCSLTLARRLELVAWARATRAWIVENDHNCETFYEGTPIEAVQAVDDAERVLYVGTFSRLFAPYPSIAYAVIPPPLVDLFRSGSRLQGTTFSALEVEALAEFIERGEMERLLRRASRRLNAMRRILLSALRALPVPVEVLPSSGGLHLYVRIPGWSAARIDLLVEQAAAAGVGIYPGAPFFLRSPESFGFLLGFARHTEVSIREGVARLGEVLDRMREK